MALNLGNATIQSVTSIAFWEIWAYLIVDSNMYDDYTSRNYMKIKKYIYDSDKMSAEGCEVVYTLMCGVEGTK